MKAALNRQYSYQIAHWRAEWTEFVAGGTHQGLAGNDSEQHYRRMQCTLWGYKGKHGNSSADGEG